jgi:hypothetical protein
LYVTDNLGMAIVIRILCADRHWTYVRYHLDALPFDRPGLMS